MAFKIGILPDAFWRMTPFELRLCIEASNESLADEMRKLLWLAWHTGYLGRVDKFPHLSELMPKVLGGATAKADPDAQRKAMSRDLMNALMRLRPNPENASGAEPGAAANDQPSSPVLEGDA